LFLVIDFLNDKNIRKGISFDFSKIKQIYRTIFLK